MHKLLKEAALTPFRARAVEAGLGAVVGAGAASYLGHQTFQTEKPRYWLQDGQVFGRDLTRAEKNGLAKRLAAAAVIGAGSGATASLGGSAIRRAMLHKTDIAEAQKLFQSYYGTLDGELRRAKYWNNDAAVVAKYDAASTVDEIAEIERRRDLAHAALAPLRDLKENRLPTSEGFVERAKKERAHHPWGGPRYHGSIPLPTTVEGQMVQDIGLQNLDHANPDPALRRRPRDSEYWQKRVLGLIRG
jgi:hypothetical protein